MRKLIVLAAGKGTRMKSDIPKVMHHIANRPMVERVIQSANPKGDAQVVLVVGFGADQVRDYFGDRVVYAEQLEQLGTGHAVMMAAPYIEDEDDVLIVCGDTPLLTAEDFLRLESAKKDGVGAVIMTATIDNPSQYGRIVEEQGMFRAIVEERDCTPQQREIQRINVGTYLIEGRLLKEALSKLSTDNDQGEYYLTDVFADAAKTTRVATVDIDPEHMLGVNSKQQLAEAERLLRARVCAQLMADGVVLKDPQTAYIDPEVVIGRDAVIYPNCHLIGETVIGERTVIRENTTIECSIIGSDTVIKASTLLEAQVGNHTSIGPNAYLRPKAKIGNHCKIGDFVEVKNATLGDGTKASHLAYIGDAEIGAGVNIGCGVVFVNYDGKNKFRSVVGDHSFIGSNANLVAPVEIGAHAFVAAGSTITQDVPPEALGIARGKQYNKENWVKKH